MGHIIPILEGGLVFLILEVFLYKPVFLIYIVLVITLVVLLGMLIPKQRFLNGREFWHYLASPIIFVWSAVLLLIFLESVYLKQFFVLGVALYIFFYFENLLQYLLAKDEEGSSNFLRMSNLMNVVSIFFLSAGLFGIKTFIQFPIWILGIIFFIFSSGAIYTSFSILKIKFRKIFWEISIPPLLVTEIFLAVHFLPISFYAAGAIVAICYYMLAGMLINKLKRGTVPYKRYLIVGSILLFLVSFTARWV